MRFYKATEEVNKSCIKYGVAVGDRTVSPGWSSASELIVFSDPAPFGSVLHRYCRVSVDGFITFGEPSYAYHNDLVYVSGRGQHILAPFWSSTDPYNSGNVYYHLYERVRTSGSYFNSSKKDDVLKMATDQVRRFYVTEETKYFNASTVLIITYENIRPYSWYSYYWYYNSQYFESETNTFQILYITDGETSYAVTIYRHGAMKWRYVGFRRIVVGFATPDRIKDFDLTYTTLTTTLDTDVGTAGIPGVYIDQVGKRENSAQKCTAFYYNNIQQARSAKFESDKNQLFRCPCTRDRLGRQWWHVETRGVNQDIDCYAITPIHMSRRFPGNTLNKLCCYKTPSLPTYFGWWWWWDWWNVWRQASYVSGTPDAGHILTANPFLWWGDGHRSLTEDFYPHRWCCQESDKEHCDLFKELRPDMGCSLDAEMDTATFWGDPHIITLDGLQYTLNVWGEYTMMETQNSSFIFQARTDRVTDKDGELTNATVFVAFAAQEGNEAKFQVELSRNKTQMVVFADGIDLTTEFYASVNFTKFLENFTVNREDRNETQYLIVSFPIGVGLKISMGNKSLEVSVEVDKTLRGKLRGLMGNFNGNKSDDLQLPDGTILFLNRTEQRKIFENFGKKWEVTINNTIFKYNEGESATDYKHPDFVPLFLEDFNDTEVEAAENICGAENDACIFDLLTTKDEEFAKNTNNTNEESAITKTALANILPNVTVSRGLNSAGVWEVVSGQQANISVLANDLDGDNITYILVSGNNENVSITDDGTIIYIPDVMKPVQIGVRVSDSRGGTSNTEFISVVVCPDCFNGGSCDRTRVAENSTFSGFSVYACNCSTGYTGANCEQNRNECLDQPCIVGQECTDLDPSQPTSSGTIGYRCGDCPVGYTELDGRCADVNECNATGICGYECTNTEGSYLCYCAEGYRLDPSDKKTCLDINECDERTDDCEQSCNNTDGSYTCSCFSGYTLISNKTCTQDQNDTKICQSASCSQLCQVVSGKPSCTCSSGYRLDTDNRTCLNINECDNVKKRCGQNCTDTDGGFVCSCYPGYKLEADKLSCTNCPKGFYGENCSGICQCSGQGKCDAVYGCRCYAGWEGEKCNTDINECERKLDNCTVGQVCRNNNGSFSCDCQVGYEKSAQGCKDINECSSATHNCNLKIEDCVNTEGSYVCNCKAGFVRNQNNTCEDIDECASKTDTCQHICINVVGGYNCDCRYGYASADDRRNCVEIKKVCSDADRLNCSHGCSVNLTTNTAYCFCDRGYHLVDGKQCEDINECNNSSTNLCSNTSSCVNTDGGFECSCKAGSKLDNDRHTCIGCVPNVTWGEDCANDCGCSTGAAGCNVVTGCYCLKGYNGSRCELDIDQCRTGEVSCDLESEVCVNRPGNDTCECRSGFELKASGKCEDVNECASSSLNNCSQVCNNTDGGFICSCLPGYTYNSTDWTCNDIDECEMKTAKCDQNCMNIAGTYVCSCNSGFRLSLDGFTCQDIDLCSSSQCSHMCVETASNTSFQCLCPVSMQLAEDNITCQVLPALVGSYNFLIALTSNVNESILNNASSDEYRALKKNVETELLNKLNRTVPGLVNVTVISMTINGQDQGNFKVNATVFTNKGESSNSAGAVVSGLNHLYNENFNISGSPATVASITVGALEVKDQDQCTVHMIYEKCADGQECVVENGISVCRAKSSGKSNTDLIIGLSVGIPLFLLLCTIIAVLVVLWVRRKRKGTPSTSQESHVFGEDQFRSTFASQLGKRQSWGAGSRSDAYSGLSYGGQNPRFDHREDPWSGSLRPRPTGTGAANRGNFSWDFLFRQLIPEGEEFKIQRPKVSQNFNSNI